MIYFKTVPHFFYLTLLLLLTSCASHEVVRGGGKFAGPIPRDSLVVELKAGEVKIGAEKQEKGIFAKPVVTEMEWEIALDRGRTTIQAMHKQLMNEFQPQLMRYLTSPRNLSARYKLKIEFPKIIVDVDGSRKLFVTVLLTPYLEERVIWYRQLTVFGGYSTPNPQMVKDCSNAILQELKADRLVD